jgi:hypothetical protein
MRLLLAGLLVAVVTPLDLRAQTVVAAEWDFTGGYSGEEIRAASSQLRFFGQAPGKVDFFFETAWGDRWAGDAPILGEMTQGVDPMGTDVFGAAYPYRGQAQVMEVFAERVFRPGGKLLGVRGGRYRTPFGISSRSDFGYSGFTRPPLIRYDGYYALSNNWLEDGAMVTAGVPQLYVEASLSRPHDVGHAIRRDGTNASFRVQGYRGQFIVGASYARSNPYLSSRFAFGRQAFGGVDARWTHPSGLQARGEFVAGHSFEGVSTRGFYVDGLLHRDGMGPFTAVVRGEWLDYTAPSPRAREARRLTIGTRARLPGPVTVQINYLRQHGDLPHLKGHTIDLSATYSLRLNHVLD